MGSLVPRVTRSAFEKFGFSTATLITEWATIVGPDLARLTAPERVKWPRLAERAPDDEGAPGGARRREGAALYLRVDGPRALDVQYKSQLIMDRINAFFGWAAVGTVRIVQGPVQGAGPVPVGRRASPAGGPAPEVVTALADPALRDAFARLYDGVARRR